MEEGGIKSRNSRNSTRGHIWGRHRKMSWIWMCGGGGQLVENIPGERHRVGIWEKIRKNNTEEFNLIRAEEM